MSELTVRVRDVFRRPLRDRIDVEVIRVSDGARVARRDDVAGTRSIRVTGLVGGEAYVARAFPFRHRAAQAVKLLAPSGKTAVEIVCPVHPDRVNRVAFASFNGLQNDLQRILARSQSAEGFDGKSGGELYEALPDISKAGLLNVYAKMDRTRFDDGTSVAQHVEDVYRFRGDRLFANVDVRLRDLVKEEASAGRLFSEVSGALHTGPPGFHQSGSFKTSDPYGNLQLTFFASDDAPLRFKVDADIDDANGISHGFQVLRNWVCDRASHPFDIHQILVYHQDLVPNYQLFAL